MKNFLKDKIMFIIVVIILILVLTIIIFLIYNSFNVGGYL